MELPKINNWDYRLVKETIDEEERYTIFEVYYDEDNNVVASWDKPIVVAGSAPHEVLWRITLMLTAFEKPTLDIEDLEGGDI